MEGLEAGFGALVADLEPAEHAEVAQALLDHIAQLPQAAALGVIPALGEQRRDPHRLDPRDDGSGAAGAVAHDLLKLHPALDGRHLGQVLEHWKEHVLVGDVGRRDLDFEYDSVGVGDHMAFAAIVAPIRWVWPGVRPPKTARTEALSTTPCCGSRPPRRPRRLRSRWCSSGQTPASVHSLNLRQQVDPETPKASRGSICHCRPVLRMKMIPRSAERSSAGGRPPLDEGPGWGRKKR